MKILLIAIFLAAALQSASGLAVQPTCPQWSLNDAALIPDALFTANVFHYNKADVMGGSPVGPYFGIDESAGCTWRENSNFNCNLRIYKDKQLTQQIGTGLLASSNLIWNHDAFNTSGGYVTLTTNINNLPVSQLPNSGNPNAPENRNFKSQTASLYFQPRVVYPDPPATPIANRVQNKNGRLFLTLWGSDGYLSGSDSFDPNTRGTGIDFQGELTCEDAPPVIPGCPCEEEGGVFSVNRGCIRDNVEIARRSAGNCVQLAFASTQTCPI